MENLVSVLAALIDEYAAEACVALALIILLIIGVLL